MAGTGEEGRGLPGLDQALADFRGRWKGTELRLEWSEAEGEAILLLEGVLDQDNSQDFLQIGSLVLREARALRTLTLDLVSLRHITSMGIATLANLIIEARSRGIVVGIAGLTPNLETLFKALGFESILAAAVKGERP